MDNLRINRIIAEQTAEQTGLKVSQVQKIIRQYFLQIKNIVGRTDFENITAQEYMKMKKRGIYVPGLGKFVMNWKIIEAYRNKKNKEKEKRNVQNKGC